MAVRSDLDSAHPLVVLTAEGVTSAADRRDCVASVVSAPTMPR